jgi:hypothetical protein
MKNTIQRITAHLICHAGTRSAVPAYKLFKTKTPISYAPSAKNPACRQKYLRIMPFLNY